MRITDNARLCSFNWAGRCGGRVPTRSPFWLLDPIGDAQVQQSAAPRVVKLPGLPALSVDGFLS
jgi:hypothetical protein